MSFSSHFLPRIAKDGRVKEQFGGHQEPAKVNLPQCYTIAILVCIESFYFVTIFNVIQKCLLIIDTDLSEFNSLHIIKTIF